MPHLKSLSVEPEDIFRETAYLVDFLLCHDEKITQRAVDNLWTQLIIDIRSWKSDTQDEDKMLVAGTVFCIVRDTLGHYHKSRLCYDIYDMLTATLNKNLGDREMGNQFFEYLTECSQSLSEWINGYEDEEKWLSEDIETCLRKRMPETKKSAGQVSPKDYSRYSFDLTFKGKYKGKENVVLEWLHNELVEKKYILDYEISGEGDLLAQLDMDEKNKLVFNAIFSGKDTDYHIVWIGDKVKLRYFILQLKERGALSWKRGPGIWQITRNRIWYGQKEKVQSGSMCREYIKYNIAQFGEHDFDKGNTPAHTEELDGILDMIAPPVPKKISINKEISDSFREYGDYESTHENSRGGKLSEGFRDTSHKARE